MNGSLVLGDFAGEKYCQTDEDSENEQTLDALLHEAKPSLADWRRPLGCRLAHVRRLQVAAALAGKEVSERLVGSPAFKAGGAGDPRPAGSIPVHLRHLALSLSKSNSATNVDTTRGPWWFAIANHPSAI